MELSLVFTCLFVKWLSQQDNSSSTPSNAVSVYHNNSYLFKVIRIPITVVRKQVFYENWLKSVQCKGGQNVHQSVVKALYMDLFPFNFMERTTRKAMWITSGRPTFLGPWKLEVIGALSQPAIIGQHTTRSKGSCWICKNLEAQMVEKRVVGWSPWKRGHTLSPFPPATRSGELLLSSSIGLSPGRSPQFF